jgi:cytochrome c oxidase assembly protein subunit 15
MNAPSKNLSPLGSPWPHRMAWLLAVGTFPLIWMGGLVTTYGAGMAVPDWPNTYGYNLFLYPLGSWLAVWDIFLEHTHRLIAASVGLVTIVLAVLLWRNDPRRWIRSLAVAAVLGVSLQGTLGGLRVLGDELLLAKIHGCTAPVFFALTTALVALTSTAWFAASAAEASRSAWLLRGLGMACLIGIYLQIVLGAQLRHIPPDSGLWWFTIWVWAHLIVAGLDLVGVVWLVMLVARRFGDQRRLVRRAWTLLALFLLQLVLGAATWVTNYGWPAWFTDYIWRLEYTVVAEGRLQVLVTTLHVAVGSLTLVSALSVALWSRRLVVRGVGASEPHRAGQRRCSDVQWSRIGGRPQ